MQEQRIRRRRGRAVREIRLGAVDAASASIPSSRQPYPDDDRLDAVLGGAASAFSRPASRSLGCGRHRHLQRHRRRDLHHARLRRRRCCPNRHGDAGVWAIGGALALCRRARVRGARGAAAAGRRRIRLYARELRRAGRVSHRLDVVRRGIQRRDCGRRGRPSPAISIASCRAPATRRRLRAGRSVRSDCHAVASRAGGDRHHRRAGADPDARRRSGTRACRIR